jgi:sulfatase maturation enzyme AslB (radical SAM superfamily)
MKSVQKTAVNLLLQYLSNNPMEKLPKMLSIAEKMDSDNLYASQIKTIREVLLDENSVWHGFAEDLFRDIDLKLLKKAMECFFVNANLAGGPIKKEMEEISDCNIPWAILMDPTSACNLSCTGCWAAQYGDKNNLSFETLDSICKQGKELGTYFYIFSGGEPLVRKKDIIRLCEANQD